MQSMTIIYLIRHGEADGNALGIFQGSSDTELSEKGRRQLDYLAERCKSLHFDAIYSSPLKRAMGTAMGANRFYNLPILIERDLREIDVGQFEGNTWDYIGKHFPDAFDSWKNDLANFVSPGGETLRDVYNRTWAAMLRIVKANPNRTVAVVSHGCAIKTLLCHAHGWPVERVMEVPWTDNTSISRIDFDDKLRPTLVFANDTDHLPEDMKPRTWRAWDQVPAKGDRQ